jgi:hypothetical protein
MNLERDRAIQLLSCDIGKHIFEEVDPAILNQFSEIERAVFPRDLQDVRFGVQSPYTQILKAVFQTIRTRGQAVDTAPTIEDVALEILDNVFSQLGELELREDLEPARIAKELENAFTKHPSLLDRASAAVQQPLKITLEKQQRLEEVLEHCVLKVIDEEKAISTAFAICNKGHILTAGHVAVDEVNRFRSLRLVYRNGEVRSRKEKETIEPVSVKELNSSIDAALLQLASRDWKAFQDRGLLRNPLELSIQDENYLRGHHVLCFGYQSQRNRDGHRMIDPSPVPATVARHNPVRNIEFVNEYGNIIHTQPCLVLIIAEGEERIGKGMSGGPVLDLETGKVIAMVTGAQRLGRIRQPYGRGEERLPLAEYGFGVLLRDIGESWPELGNCCLKKSNDDVSGGRKRRWN